MKYHDAIQEPIYFSYAGTRSIELGNARERAEKRGYLLHGPPGKGNSILITIVANYMKYYIYDLELTKVSQNQELCALLT
ncbi:hypothetical protein SUGI_0500710 [Cryptomeria japonica]|nr:hypothetical protein SUGI_0500710 [Cryptomeria japonica]